MDIRWLREHVAQLSERLALFEQMHEQLHTFYRQSYLYIHHPAALSVLMETYFIQLNRQQQAIHTMKALHQKASKQLAALESGRS